MRDVELLKIRGLKFTVLDENKGEERKHSRKRKLKELKLVHFWAENNCGIERPLKTRGLIKNTTARPPFIPSLVASWWLTWCTASSRVDIWTLIPSRAAPSFFRSSTTSTDSVNGLYLIAKGLWNCRTKCLQKIAIGYFKKDAMKIWTRWD